MTTQQYLQASERFLAQARRELADDDLAPASEKGWGAATQMLKAIAEQRGWEQAATATTTERPAGCAPRPGTATSAASSTQPANSTKTSTKTTWRPTWWLKASTTWRPSWTSSAPYWPKRSLIHSAATSSETASSVANVFYPRLPSRRPQ